MFQIPITTLAHGLHELDLPATAADLDLDPQVFRGIQVAVRLDYAGDRALVAFEARARATLTCDRTLVDFEQPVAGTYTVLFASPRTVGRTDGQIEDVRPLAPTDTVLDLTDVVRDTLLLALPARRVAPGAEDVELPTRFGAPGADAPVDPRWDALRALVGDHRA